MRRATRTLRACRGAAAYRRVACTTGLPPHPMFRSTAIRPVQSHATTVRARTQHSPEPWRAYLQYRGQRSPDRLSGLGNAPLGHLHLLGIFGAPKNVSATGEHDTRVALVH